MYVHTVCATLLYVCTVCATLLHVRTAYATLLYMYVCTVYASLLCARMVCATLFRKTMSNKNVQNWSYFSYRSLEVKSLSFFLIAEVIDVNKMNSNYCVPFMEHNITIGVS